MFGSTFLGGKPKIISAEITVDEDMNFNVSFFKLKEEVGSLEFIRLPLHYYAKLLYNLGASDPQSAQASDILLNMMGQLCTNVNGRTSNILQVVEIDDVSSISLPNPNGLKKIEVILKYIDPMNRAIVTKIPVGIYHQQVVFSLFVLLHEVQKHLSDSEVIMLFDKLRLLTSFYNNGQDFTSMRNLSLLPNKVFNG